MNPLIDLGFISIHIYSVCILIGILVAFNLIVRESKKHGFKEEDIVNLVFYAIIFGIIGARLYYCSFNLDYYITSPIKILKVWEGGLAIHGGIIGGVVSTVIYSKKKNINLVMVLDFMVVGLICAQAIGRWGNFFNGEAHGPITTLSYLESLYLPKFIIKGMYIDGNYYIPTFLYESIWCFLGFVIMIILRGKRFMKFGYLTGFYLVWYGAFRFFIEGMRTDSLMLGSFRVAQIVSVIMIIIGICIWVFSYFKLPKYNRTCEGSEDND